MPPHLILWPALFYVVASLVVPRLRFWLRDAGYTFGVLLSSVIAFMVALWVVQQSESSTLSWVMSSWSELAGAGSGIRFHVDRLGASFLLLIGLVGMGTFLGTLDESDTVTSEDYQAGLLALLGGLAALTVADNLLTLLLASLLIDVALIFGVGLAGRPRWLLATFLHALVAQGLALAAMLLLWRDSGTVTLANSSDPVLLLLIAVALVRMAPIPLSLFPLAFESLPQRVLALLPLATLGAGTVWLGRVAAVLEPGRLDLDAVVALGAIGVALGSWVAWRREEPSVRLMMLSTVQASWVLWAFAAGFAEVALATAWAGVLALAALALHGGRLDFRHGAQLPGLVAVLMVAGVPGSALWNTMTQLGATSWVSEASGMLALGTIGVMLTTVTLIEWMLPTQIETPGRSQWSGILLLAALSLPLVATWWGIHVPPLPAAEPPTAPLAAQLAIAIIGWSGGLFLWQDRARLHSLYPLLDTVAALFSFAWLWRLVGRVGWLLLSALRGMMLVLEGENYGWLLLFLFIALILLLPG